MSLSEAELTDRMMKGLRKQKVLRVLLRFQQNNQRVQGKNQRKQLSL